MKQLPHDHPRSTPAAERGEARATPRPARDGPRRPDRRASHERRRRFGDKPLPARELTAREEAAQPAQSVEADVPEVRLEVDGCTWSIRVLGRSGRPSRGEAPILLLGFWEAGSTDERAALEVSVVGRTLAELDPGRLEEALRKAAPPPTPDRKTSFFDIAHHGRRR